MRRTLVPQELGRSGKELGRELEPSGKEPGPKASMKVSILSNIRIRWEL